MTNYVEWVKQRALEVITQPEPSRTIPKIPISTLKFEYPVAEAGMTTHQLRVVMAAIDIVATHEMLHLLTRVMARD